jgi:hypothetical protein
MVYRGSAFDMVLTHPADAKLALLKYATVARRRLLYSNG